MHVGAVGGRNANGNGSECLTAGEWRSRCPSIFSSKHRGQVGEGGQGEGRRQPGDSHSEVVKLGRPPEAGDDAGGSCGTFAAPFLGQPVFF